MISRSDYDGAKASLDLASQRVDAAASQLSAQRAAYDVVLARAVARLPALLEYLLRRTGQVVSKATLLEHVWDSFDTTELNAVEVYAGYLRRKIDIPFGRSALQTVRGAGYRLAADGG